MRARTRRGSSFLVSFALALLVPCASAQTQGQDGKEEVLEKIDPYTHGEREALDKAGYVSEGPFEWSEGVRTDEVAETLGAGTVLWIETAHFKIGSTLASYKLHNDTREEKALDDQLARLKPRLQWYQPPRNRLDPWMRTHLLAQRLENVYADFTAEFGFAGGEARTKKPSAEAAPDTIVPPKKFTVLLTEKTSSLGRYLKRYTDRESRSYDRCPLPGGSMFLGVSAEGLRTQGFDLEVAFHCVVAAEVTRNLVDGFANSWFTCPYWLEYGLAHVAARKVDERFVPSAIVSARANDEDAWKWEPRVRGLVQNGVAPAWTDTLAWEKWEDMKTPGHLVSWSRVSWLLKRKPDELRTFLIGMVKPPADRAEEDHGRIGKAQQIAAARAAFGKTFEELDAQWRKAVLRN
jgi:hypothetical protein